MSVSDDDRSVELDEDFAILPDQTSDDTDRGWGEQTPRTTPAKAKGKTRTLSARDRELLADRPPHWS
ncbi:hypothetical protein AB0B28_04915 [Glycomyces sp. NPDC046736]|uniref:hypothetical protein n=1 Tax=Glycomyces sp. NPDC046736 TaxID=3155615 RepID=UPI003400B1C8